MIIANDINETSLHQQISVILIPKILSKRDMRNILFNSVVYALCMVFKNELSFLDQTESASMSANCQSRIYGEQPGQASSELHILLQHNLFTSPTPYSALMLLPFEKNPGPNLI